MDILLLNVGATIASRARHPSPRHRVYSRLIGTKSNRAAIALASQLPEEA